MDFTVDKENCQVKVKREFAAPLAMVWEAWTEAEILDQWWAPRPYKTETRETDFREGGLWFYAMKGPEGDVHWCQAHYGNIHTEKSLTWLDAFCDEDGNLNTQFPRSNWSVQFEQEGDRTLVKVNISHQSLQDLEMIIQMGFKEGFTMALGNLEEILA